MNTILLSKLAGVLSLAVIGAIPLFIDIDHLTKILPALGGFIGTVLGAVSLFISSINKSKRHALEKSLEIEQVTTKKLEKRVDDVENDLREERKLVQELKLELGKSKEEYDELKMQYHSLLDKISAYEIEIKRKEEEVKALKKKLTEK